MVDRRRDWQEYVALAQRCLIGGLIERLNVFVLHLAYSFEEIRARTFGLANAMARRWGIGRFDAVFPRDAKSDDPLRNIGDDDVGEQVRRSSWGI